MTKKQNIQTLTDDELNRAIAQHEVMISKGINHVLALNEDKVPPYPSHRGARDQLQDSTIRNVDVTTATLQELKAERDRRLQ